MFLSSLSWFFPALFVPLQQLYLSKELQEFKGVN